jgi:hypothetical protein
MRITINILKILLGVILLVPIVYGVYYLASISIVYRVILQACLASLVVVGMLGGGVWLIFCSWKSSKENTNGTS